MDEQPYKFESSNPRVASNVERHSQLTTLSAAIFLGSLYIYSRRIFRIDQNAFKFLTFTGASAFASYQWASAILSSPTIEAGLINNAKELQH